MNSKKSIINKKCENTKNKHVSNRRGGNVSLYNGLTFYPIMGSIKLISNFIKMM